MRRIGFVLTILFACVTSLGLAQAHQGAQFVTKKADADDTERAAALSNAMLARQLAVYGSEHNVPLALVTAARILSDNPVTHSTDQPQSGARRGVTVTERSRQEVTEPALDPAELLKAARSMSGGDSHLGMIIDHLSAELPTTARGATGGPIYRDGRVRAGYYNWYG